MKGIENLTKIKTYIARTGRALTERLNYGGELILSSQFEKDKQKIDTKKLTRIALSLVCSFILARGRMAFGTYPLALALTSSATSLSPILALGSVLGSLTLGEGSAYLLAYALSLLLRFSLTFAYVKPSQKGLIPRLCMTASASFSESLYIRMALSLPPAFLSGIYLLVSRGFYFHDLAGLLFMTVFTPAAVFVFSGAFEREKGGRFFPLGVGAIVFSLVFSLGDAVFLGISLQVAAIFFIIIYAARAWGPVASSLAGALAGLAVSPLHVPLFALSGIASGALIKSSFYLAVLASITISGSLGLFFFGLSSLVSLVPSALLGCVLFSLSEAAGLVARPSSLAKSKLKAGIEPIAEKKHRALREELTELCDSFTALSDIFMNISSHVRVPSVSEFKDICDATCDKYCAYCSRRALCWDREYGSTYDMIGKLATELHRYGRASEKSVPEQIKARCAPLGDILEEINSRAARAIEDALSRDRAEVVGCDYAAFSSIISEALKRCEDDYAIDENESRRLFEAFSLSREEFPIESVLVWGERQKHVRLSGVGASAIRQREADLKRKIEKLTKLQISTPALEITDDGINISFDVAPRYSVECAKSLVSADGSECGDSVSSFEGLRSYSYLLVSDGMGKGKLAALSSGLCSVFMERMLGSGMRAESALKMLTALLRAKGIECSSSLDLAEFDLIEGRVCFVKSGAAPSFVRRGGNLFRLESKTLPIGIMKTLDAEQIKFDLMEGDAIIMLSDGVCEDFESCAWLPTMLVDEWENDIQAMADKIAREAAVRCHSKDDISVGIAMVGKR